jgi:hypothetical protein
VHLDPEPAQERLGEPARGHPRGGLARARALEHVAHVGEAVLLHPREIRVPGPRQVDLVHLGVDRPRIHPLLPVRVVAVRDPHGDRAAKGAAVADARRHLAAVGLDLHAAAAPVAELPPGEVAVEVLGAELQPGRKALDDRHEPRPVRFPRRGEAKCSHATTLLRAVISRPS